MSASLKQDETNQHLTLLKTLLYSSTPSLHLYKSENWTLKQLYQWLSSISDLVWKHSEI